jgi:CRP-like cAMP-binding protein
MHLDQTPLFQQSGIDTSSIHITHHPGGHTLEMEGNDSTYVGVVLDGTIDVITYTIQGNPIRISTLTEGTLYGDALFYSTERPIYPGNLQCRTDVTLARIPNETFDRFLRTNDTFAHNVLRILADKVIRGTKQSKLLSQDSIRDKILYFLAEESKRQQSNVIRLESTKEDLAKRLHTTRPSLSRELAHMKQDGLIHYDRNSITIR